MALLYIRHNISAARRFTAAISFEPFKQSDMHFNAVTRTLEIVSEAARRLSEDFRERHPSLPWKQIASIGNVLRRDYDNMVEAIVWDASHDHLNALLAVVLTEIGTLEHEP